VAHSSPEVQDQPGQCREIRSQDRKSEILAVSGITRDIRHKTTTLVPQVPLPHKKGKNSNVSNGQWQLSSDCGLRTGHHVMPTGQARQLRCRVATIAQGGHRLGTCTLLSQEALLGQRAEPHQAQKARDEPGTSCARWEVFKECQRRMGT
jgi:hypothetical protein